MITLIISILSITVSMSIVCLFNAWIILAIKNLIFKKDEEEIV